MDLFEQIKEKINKKINPDNIILIDNSRFHSKHKSFDPKKSVRQQNFCGFKICLAQFVQNSGFGV